MAFPPREDEAMSAKKKPPLTARQKTLLLFLGAGGEIDPIRIMKGLFVFAMETPAEWLPSEARYKFVAYDYGPCSRQVYSDLATLEQHRYVNATETPGHSWKYYSLTDEGHQIAKVLSSEMHTPAVNYLNTLREFVSRLSFRQLLATIYHKYPEYAVNSVFKS
jgi:hypothetical protein